MNQRTRKKCVFIKATPRCPSPQFSSYNFNQLFARIIY